MLIGMKIYYNPKLKELARQLRNDATKSEVKLWSYLRRDQMHGYDFHRQKPIDEFIVDFFCNKLQLAIECDEYTHEIELGYRRDMKKTKRLNDLGIIVMRFSEQQIMNDIDTVLSAIKDYILKFEENNLTPPSVPPF
jgi:very-short-patch-repair endonuclease